MGNLTLSRKKFDIEEYHQIINIGIFKEDYTIELIKGEIFEMSPVGFKHASCVNKLNQFFSLQFGHEVIISVQNPIKLNNNSEPQPDLVLLKPREDFYGTQHPTPDDIFLLIEVADSSIEYDRNVKLPIYAESKIQEVWLIDLNQNFLETYKNPEANYYQNMQKLSNNNIVTLNFPHKIDINVNNLF
ncbi:MAG: Uma2 family endonuclease [Cyanobacteria bacterium]|nr:Uma2 family endonuclease [Cyanobacteria bacterium CG_2015-16_32_12]NCO77994.1 Uma2 family endonuclease [Cyanobacteria bacterium CG_2015-22_32_23]NCQ03987.1 Uma2 family endonuclease [Cyanobacteria bacterium CG_2015-09_32_10]NCQ40693.1 Uma2 family endonuclease [Cyanobacteria bacterium CG_2015-04_32_10]NCS84744.1 Uma2 family endonuclease [Cyanobacteria bacterium CG_2015-02_32_10]